MNDTASFVAHTTMAGIVLTDRSGRIEWVNAGFERLTGWRLAEIRGRKPGDFLQGRETDPATVAKMRAAIAAGDGFKVEVLNYHRSGESYWLSIECEPRRDADGNVTGFTAIQTDITQQVLTEKKLRDTAQRLRVALDASQIGVWRYNLQTGQVEWDQRIYEMTEVARHTKLPRGHYLLRHLHRDDRRWLRQQIERLCRGTAVVSGEIRIRLPRRRTIHVETRMVLSRDASGHPEWVTGVNTDITARKRNEQHLVASLREVVDLKTALDEHAIVAVTDARGKIVRVNQRFCAVSGYTQEELLGSDHRLINSRTHPPEFFHELWRTISSGNIWHGEICNRTKAGALYWVDTTIVPFLGDNGKPVQYIAIRADVTARKLAEERRVQMEQQLARTRKLESLGNFAGGIAHDFNNLIAGIGGHIELALMDLPGESPAAPLLQTAERGCQRARDLAKRLLMFARRGTTPELIAVNLAKLVRETVPILRPTLGTAVRMDVSVEDDLPLALADEGQLMQVLMNLCINGAHAIGPKGGTLSVSIRTADLPPTEAGAFPEAKPGTHVVLSVKDTGCGMDAATKARVFEPFFTTKAEKGTGLGLSVVHGIVRQHKGAIVIHSAPGCGTTFDIFLPLAHKAAATTRPAKPIERILVVDDEPNMLAMLVQVLRARGFDAHGTDHPRAALDRLKSQPHGYDLLVSDFLMPGMNGDELAQQVRTVRPNLPIVLVSGTRDPLSEDKARTLGIRAQFQKPFTADELTTCVTELLQEARAA